LILRHFSSDFNRPLGGCHNAGAKSGSFGRGVTMHGPTCVSTRADRSLTVTAL